MPQHSSPFEVLGLTRDCSLDQANLAFRKLALKVHPDKAPADQKETATTKMALINAAIEKVNEILANASTVQGFSTPAPYPKHQANDKPKISSPSASASTEKGKRRDLSKRHARLLHRIEEISNIIRTRTSSPEGIALSSIACLKEQLQCASKAASDGSLDAPKVSTRQVHTVVKAIKNKVKELERRVNARRTIGGQYRPEEVEALNHTVSTLVTDLLTGKMRSTGTE